MKIKLDAAALTDPGRGNRLNEDVAWAQVYAPSEGDSVGLFLVCDGIGGHLGGELASYWAAETIKRQLAGLFAPQDPRATVQISLEEIETAVSSTQPTRKLGDSWIESRVRQAIEQANAVVYQYARQKPRQAGDAGTTVTLALVKGERATIANVGDSRTYLLRERRLRQVTQDHSLVASLVASGQIRPEEVFSHPQRNVIYRSLGQKGKVLIDVFSERLQPGDYLLLCSDGLWEMVQDEGVMARLVESAGDPEQACRKLVEAANAAGGEDNIGVVVVKIDN